MDSEYMKPQCFGKEYSDTDPECYGKCALRSECERATHEHFKTINNTAGYGNYGGGYGNNNRYNYGHNRFDTPAKTDMPPVQRQAAKFGPEEQEKANLGQKIAHNAFVGCMRTVLDESYNLIVEKIASIRRY